MTKAERAEAIAHLRMQGKSIRQIAESLGIHRSTVCEYIAAFKFQKGGQCCPHCKLPLSGDFG